MVDPGEELYLLKENIKPLKKGRMMCQLGTAVLAEDDQEAHQQLLKQREKYEVLLRSYEGSDPLELWYEYILWVEQSFLRDSREGNLYVLLERCLAHFKEDERYLQDRRYIELWIKYIEMSADPLEVYQKCNAHGIGKYCALFYMSWAFEFEKAGDLKRADQVFSEGFNNNSQPVDELEEAHKNFQFRVARQFLSGNSEVEGVCTDQRVVLCKLKAHGHKKNMVGSVRVGASMQRGSAGILQSIPQHGSNSSNVQTGPVKVFSDKEDDISAEFAMLRGVHLSSIPRREILNKENFLEPGPWTGKPRKNQKAAVFLPRPQQPSFELHRDDEVQVQKSSFVICNALKPRKLDDDEFKCAIAVFEPDDPFKRPMYCKNKVYAGGTEFSFEELRAIEYLKGNKPARCKQGKHGTKGEPTVAKLYGEEMHKIKVFEAVEHRKRNTNLPLAEAPEKQNFNLYVDLDEEDRFGTVSHVVDTEDVAPEFSDIEPPHITYLPAYSAKMSGESYDQSFCHQSLTYNTKEAMNMMHELWTTPEDKKLQCNFHHVGGSESKKKTLPLENVDTQCLQAEQPRQAFDIFKDESVIHEEGENDVFCAPKPERKIDRYKISRDEVEEGGIPLVPSPGMTEEEEKALSGTEMKENISPEGVLELQIEKRNVAGILQSSADFPCDPQEDPALQDDSIEPETYYSNVTCNTQVFSCPLLSSTPLVGQHSDRNTAESTAKTWYCCSDEVNTHRSAGSTAHTVPNLSTIMETMEPYKSSSSSGGSGATHHTAMSFQENSIADNTKRNDNIHKSNRNSGLDRGIPKAWQEYCNVQEVCRQDEQYSSDHLIVKITAESFHHKTESLHPPEEPNPSVNVDMEESGNSVLQEEPNSNGKQGEILGCQQIRGRNSRSLKNSTGLKLKCEHDEELLKSEDENLFHAKTDVLGHMEENKGVSEAYKADSLRTQENCLAGDFLELPFEGPKVIDPFDLALIQKLLACVGFPNAECSKCCVKVNVQMPRFKIGGAVALGKDKFTIEKILGEGSYAKVFKAIDMGTQKTVALKIQKPSWEWEFYICHQLQTRLSNSVSAMAFMNVHKAYILNNGSVMVTDYSKYGSLLSVLVKLRQDWEPVPEDLFLYWMIELLAIAEKLQQCCIIHGDIKPDNFVLRTLPSPQSKEPSLQLIDMGRGIDMTLFPEATTFNTVVTTKDFQCIEMQTKRPWTYQIDLYGIAGTMHCMYFSQYMKVCKESDGRWFIRQSISRYSRRHLWEQFFYTLLNVESCEKLPDLSKLRHLVEAEISSNKHFSDLTRVRNILGGK